MRRKSLWEGKWLRKLVNIISLPGYIGWYSCTFACTLACDAGGGCCMYGLVLCNLQGLVVILDNDMPAIDVCVELLRAKAH